MSSPSFKTRSEQKLEWLESLDRPLTDEESNELHRALHAVYCRNLKLQRAARIEREVRDQVLTQFDKENAIILRRMEREARQ